MMASYRWDEAEFTCLVGLWHAESGWSWSATNPSSGAYGIPQALPGWKMASAGSDWLTNPATQITWGMDYIAVGVRLTVPRLRPVPGSFTALVLTHQDPCRLHRGSADDGAARCFR